MNKLYLARTTTDPKILDELSKDGDCYVRWRVAKNPNTSPETLKKMSIVEEDYYLKYRIENNPNCSEETRRYLLAVKVVEDIMCE